MIPLKPQDERPSGASSWSASCARKTSGIPGLNVFVQNQPALRIGGMSSKSQYQYSLLDADADELLSWVPQMVDGCASCRASRM